MVMPVVTMVLAGGISEVITGRTRCRESVMRRPSGFSRTRSTDQAGLAPQPEDYISEPKPSLKLQPSSISWQDQTEPGPYP